MRIGKLLLLGLAGLGAFTVAGMGSVAVAAPKGSLEEVVEVLRGVLNVNVVNSTPIAVKPVVPAEQPVMLEFGDEEPNYVVPEGKLLVIQAVSFDVNESDFPFGDSVPSGTIFVADFDRSNPDIKFFFFPVEHFVMDSKWVTSAQTTIYAVAGREVGGSITPFGPSQRITVAGVLRDAP